MHIQIKHITLLFLLLVGMQLSAQNIAVAGFDLDEMDLTANLAGTTVMDQNGEKCALIKVETTQTGFNFDVGLLGVTKTEQHTAEIWVYVPHGVKRMTISHQQLGILRDYYFPVQIERAKTYIMKLTTGTVQTIVTEAKVKTGWILLDSNPSDASVYIDDEYVGNTPLENLKKPYGNYTYRIEKDKYHNTAGKIVLDKPKYEETITLSPNFGTIRVTSNVSGAKVALDGNSTGKTTPCTLEEVGSGDHKLTIQKEKYAPKQMKVVVEDGKTANVNANLDARFARITVNTTSGADIFLNGTKVGTTTYSDDLMEGYKDFEVRLAHHRSASKQVEVIAGEDQTISFRPTPIYGSIDIASSPRNAKIFIDGKDYGTTPTTIEELLEGDHQLKLTLDGHATYTKTLSISEGENSAVMATLPNGRQVTITSDKAGAVIYVDGQQVGNAPYNGSLSFGSHEMYAVAGGKQSSRQRVNVKEGNGEMNVALKFDDRAVDLGLSVMWASCNVGAEKPEDYGDYFAWGETKPKSDYSWSTYFDTKDNGNSFTKYNSNGGKTKLDPKDDAATANWGSGWRMPTKAELEELKDKCTWTWTTQNGVNGYKVTGKNGNSIFLPAAGYRYVGSLSDVGSSGYFWSSSLRSGRSGYAYYLGFSSGIDWYFDRRYNGQSVRPVCASE